MATEPIIFTKNYVNADDAVTVDSGSGTWPYIYDRDKDSQWKSSGANDDTTDVTITITFYEGTGAVSRTIDSLLLVNHNVKAFDIYYWNGSSFISWHSFTGLASSTTFYSLASQTTAKVQIVLHTTQSANQEKAIGELCLMALQLNVGADMYAYAVQFRQKVKDIPLGDGSLHRAVIPWTKNRITKYEANVQFHLIDEATKTALLAVKQSGQPFLWYPESITKPDEIWFVHWADPGAYQYASYVKSAGWDLTMDLKEV